MSHGRYHLTNVSCGNNSHVWWRFLVHVRLSDVRWASSLKSCISIIIHAFFTMQVSSCDRCQRNNKKLDASAGVLHPIPVKAQLWHQVGMDIIGPLPETSLGNKYIITLSDYFSKWAEATAPSRQNCSQCG